MSDLRATPLYDRALGCLLGGLIGDAMGTPSENLHYGEIIARFGWIDDLQGSGTDDTLMKDFLAQALIETEGAATLDDWARVWMERWPTVTAEQRTRFFSSVVHTVAKLRSGNSLPRMVALGNMPSSSTAMCISPVGIVHACHPELAALHAGHLAALIHVHDVAFCQDGARAMAAAVAAAFIPGATVESILDAARRAILPTSGRELLDRVDAMQALALETGAFAGFRDAVYELGDRFLMPITCDTRETVPLTLALFRLAGGDLRRMVTYGANLGRDADTIASMGGAIAGAWQGARALPEAWVARATAGALQDQYLMAEQLARVALKQSAEAEASRRALESLL